MTKEKRLPFLVLANEIDWVLCCFCKYHDSQYCGEGNCTHPIDKIAEETIYPEDDCWAFYPSKGVNVSLVADIVGIILREGFANAYYTISDSGRVEVCGTVRK